MLLSELVYNSRLMKAFLTLILIINPVIALPTGIIFDSNKNGTFGLFAIDKSGNVNTILDTPAHEIYPFPSPDGNFIVYSVADKPVRDSRADVWIVYKDKKPKLLVKNGTFPSTDGKSVFFEREQRNFYSFDLETRNIKKIFPTKKSGFKGALVAKPRIFGDWIAFTASIPTKWNTWRYNIKTDVKELLGNGCQPTKFKDHLLWVEIDGEGNRFINNKKIIYDLKDKKEYFPEVFQDRFIFFGACPLDQHDHYTSNYEIFFTDLESDKTEQLTNFGSSSRWPRVFDTEGWVER